VRFKMVIKVDAGIVRALALDDELVVATEKPAAVQCIRWTPDSNGNQTSTELLSRMSWMSKKVTILEMIHDRPMNLSTWITNDGRAYAVQRLSGASQDANAPKKLFKGYCFHNPESEGECATRAAINARFSLIAVGCKNGSIFVYTVRDYAGNIPLSYKLKPIVSLPSSGRINSLNYSPDGYCLFAGFEKGWITWSVYGKPGGASFTSDRHISESNGEEWLNGIREASWLGGGSEILLVAQNDDRLWVLEMARSAVAGCFSAANISRSLLQTNSGFMVYRGYDQPDLTTISAESSLWHHVQIPHTYLADQWPIRQAVISPDGRYVAVAGRRGLAHYSVNSGRWKTFVSENMENEFVVRGGMCWYQHILIAAVESGDRCEVTSNITRLRTAKLTH
jgi:WD40 repeat protein